jgi:hypothetical protein
MDELPRRKTNKQRQQKKKPELGVIKFVLYYQKD